MKLDYVKAILFWNVLLYYWYVEARHEGKNLNLLKDLEHFHYNTLVRNQSYEHCPVLIVSDMGKKTRARMT